MEAIPIGSMGRTVYLPTWMVDFDGFHVGTYTSPMDPMGYGTMEVQPTKLQQTP